MTLITGVLLVALLIPSAKWILKNPFKALEWFMSILLGAVFAILFFFMLYFAMILFNTATPGW